MNSAWMFQIVAEHIHVFVALLVCSNGLGLGMMLGDKFASGRGMRRMPERNLWLCAALYGSAGCLVGMYAVRHKTRKQAFVVGMPLLFLLQLASILWFAQWAGYVHFL